MRAGIVGYGLAGRYFHASTLVSAGFDVAAICTRSLEKKAIAHQDFPGAILVNSIDELVEEDLDLIVIASTNDVHAEHAKAAIDAGIATGVDKPMGVIITKLLRSLIMQICVVFLLPSSSIDSGIQMH